MYIAFYKANWTTTICITVALLYGWQPVRFGDPRVQFRIDYVNQYCVDLHNKWDDVTILYTCFQQIAIINA